MIYDMDWRALGYWPIWKDGKKIWERDQVSDQRLCLPTVTDDEVEYSGA